MATDMNDFPTYANANDPVKPTSKPAPVIVDYTKADTSSPSSSVVKDFEATVEKYRGNLPKSFIMALASKGKKENLFGLSEAVLASYPGAKLEDVDFNTKVACTLLQKIVAYFAANYPKTMFEQWNNQNYVALIVHGYNVGYAEPKGLGQAIKKFNDTPAKMSIDTVGQMAKQLGLSENMSNTKWIAYAKDVAARHIAQANVMKSDAAGPMATGQGAKSGGMGMVAIAGAAVLGFFAINKGK